MRREKLRRGWERFKNGFKKVINFGKKAWKVGKKIASGVGKVAAFAWYYYLKILKIFFT